MKTMIDGPKSSDSLHSLTLLNKSESIIELVITPTDQTEDDALDIHFKTTNRTATSSDVDEMTLRCDPPKTALMVSSAMGAER